MKKEMRKIIKAVIVVGLLIFLTTAVSSTAEEPGAPSRDYTHTVLCEVGTAQWCPPCHSWNTNLYNFWVTGDYDFEYVELIVEDPYGAILNYDARARVRWELGLTAWPSSYFDGDYRRIVGNYPGQLPGALDACGGRIVDDIYAEMTVRWLGNATMEFDVSIQNNESYEYNGHMHAYITEIVSRYTTVYGAHYHFGFLDYAFNQDITISPGGIYTDSTIWNGNDYTDAHGDDFGDITMDNIKIVLAVFDDTTMYTDETIAAFPTEIGVDPDLSYVTLTAENHSGLTTCPARDVSPLGTEIYEYVKVTVRNSLGDPMPGILADDVDLDVHTGPGCHFYSKLGCTFTPVDPVTDANGEIRFTVQGDTSIQGYITITAAVMGTDLNDADDLLCNSYDQWISAMVPQDGVVALQDFGKFASDWATSNWESDYNWNGMVELVDFGMFASHWAHSA